MKNYVIISVLALVFLSSCSGCNDSDWAEVTIPSEAQLVFINTPESNLHYYGNIIAIPLDSNFTDTLFVSNHNLMEKLCYFKLSHPDKDIRLEYVKKLDNNTRNAELRFIHLAK